MQPNPQTLSSPFPRQDRDAVYFLDVIPDLAARAETFRTSSKNINEKILRVFAEQMRLTIRVLQEAVEGGDEDSIRRQAHSLQGMGGTVGVPEISVVGEELSRLAKRGDLERCRELTERLNRWQTDWDSSSASVPAGPLQNTPTLSGRILIVDDELPNRLYLRKLLSDHGATVIEADNGDRALALAQQQTPDLALVDVVMPGMSGYDVCRKLVKDSATCHVPVIMVTARSTVEDIEHAFVLGAFDHIRKPFHDRELLARVRNALQLKQQSDELRKWQRLMTRELDVAGALQRKLLSTDPFFSETAEVRSAYQSSMSVGGDVFNAFLLPNGNLCAYVGDVAGHGVGSALVSTLLKVLIEEVASDYADRGPAAMCNQIHFRFGRYITNPELYATLFLAVLEPDGLCTTLNCGHPAPLLFDAYGNSLPPFENRGGLPIGLSPQDDVKPYHADDEAKTVLPKDAVMAIFSDGLLEARQSASAKPCGDETLGNLLAQALCNPDSADPAQEVMRRLGGLGYQLNQDDCTLMVVAQHGPAAYRMKRSIALSHQEAADLAAEVLQVLQEEGWPEEASRAVQLLVMEHGANVVDHAAAPPGSRITFSLRLSDQKASLLFRDFGLEWDFQTRLASSLNQKTDSCRGRGLRIIRTLAKHIDNKRQNHENITQYIVSRFFEVSPTNENESVPHE
ncbi:MAG: response regulator [Kiritimatiellales bacterium]